MYSVFNSNSKSLPYGSDATAMLLMTVIVRTNELLHILLSVYVNNHDNQTVYCTISEYAAQGCLYDHLANNKLNFEQILRWSTEIALGKQVIFKCSSVHVSDFKLHVKYCRHVHV